MKHWKLIVIFLFSHLALPALAGLEYVPNQLIFKTSVPKEISMNKTGLNEFDNFLEERQIKNLKPVLNKSQNKYFIVSFNEDIDWDNIKNLSFEGIDYFQPNYINTLFITPNDPEYINQQIDLENCNIPQAWNHTTGNEEIIVAVIDSGLRFDHPDLQNNIFINSAEIPDDGIDNDNNGYIDDDRGWDFVDAPELYSIAYGDYTERDNDPSDDLNHGTHVSGIIAADTNNNEGVCGICWNIKLLVIRAGFKSLYGGYLQDDDAAAGIIYATDMGADIINLSWGDVNFSQIIADACYYAYQRGSIIIASGGNISLNNTGIMYPGKLSTTIAVGAVDKNKNLAGFSCYGPQLDIVAPGNQILSTYDVVEGYYYQEQSGTSMSAPITAGSLALLLSYEPGLSFEEVRGRLISSVTDLGEQGYDHYYGYGLLDVSSLLMNQTYPEISISYPLDNEGLNESFDIIGTVKASNFWRYSVMYTSEELPTSLDWKDVQTHNATPTWFMEEVEDDVLANFDVTGYFPDGTYQIKVEMVTSTNDYFTYIRTVHIDQTPPEFKDEYAAVMKRYNAEIPEYFIQAVFDEKVNLSINTPPLTDYSLVSNYADSIHVFKLFDSYQSLQPIDLKAENLAGLESFFDNAYSIEIDNNCVNLHGFEQIPIGNELVAVRNTYDFDGNGKRDFIAQEIDGEDRVLKIFELSDNELITKYEYTASCWPHDIGDTDGRGWELLGVTTGNIAVIYETFGDVYPNYYLGLIEEALGGNFVDYDDDGIDEIILIKDINVGDISYRVLTLNERVGDTFTREYEIFNETSTSVKNEFVNKVACGNLDGDDHPDILAADKDGDVMIFEKESANFEMVWHCRLPVSEAYYLALADFTGDGLNEFCVGGYTYNSFDPAKSFSYFEFFKNTGENNEYGSLGYLSFSQIETKNSIANADLDGDGDDELVLSVPPNTYIIDYVDNKFTPIWKGESTKTSLNVMAASPKTATEEAFIIVNIQDGNEIKSSLIRKSEDFTGPQTPNMFGVFPVDSTSVTMNWLADNADSYNIYRKQDENISLVASGVINNYYTDSGLSPGDTLFYQITAVDDSYLPNESLPTLWKIAVPFYMPQLQYIKMISSYEIKVRFDRKLNSDATNITFYSVNHDMGYPQSVNIIEQNSCLIIRFSNKFEEFYDYILSINGLTGMTGVPVVLDPEDCVFQYEPDTTPPEISNVESEDMQTVNVYFSESVNSEMVEDISNYILVPPALDKNNEIVSLEYNVDHYYVSIQMDKNLEYTNQPYFLKIDDLEDIAGNKISNSGNKCHFSLTGMLGLKNLKQMQVYPNPLDQRKSEFDVVNFINLPLETSGRIWIYDLNGELVFEKKLGPYNDVKECFRWECKNKAGNKVSSGIYFYIIKMGTDSRKGKIVIIN